MPRAHRQLLEGGLYHVYNRFARGEEIFAEPDEAERFVSMIREAKKRDGFIVYAWCLRKDQATTRLRELVAAGGIERWGQRPGELGRVLGKHPDMVSRWARMAALRTADDLSLVDQQEALDRTIAAQAAEAEDGGS